MPLTRAQRTLLNEAEAVATLTKLDYRTIEEEDTEARIPLLRIAINNTVIAEVVTRYTLLNEILSDLIASYYFKAPKKQIHFGKLWRTKKFRTFVHHVLDETYLLKKMELVHVIKPLPSDVIKFIRKVNALRNAFAHSFFPRTGRSTAKIKRFSTKTKTFVRPKDWVYLYTIG